MTSKYLTIPVVASALGLGGAAVARAAEPTTAELMAQIQALQAKVQKMEAQQTQNPSAKEVDATVDSVLKDADKRSKLMDMEGFTAGWSEGHFMLKSADGSFSMMPELQLQFRYILDYRSDDNGNFLNKEDTEMGFEVSRAKLAFSGNAFTKDLTYNIRFVTGSAYEGSAFDSSELTLENAYLQHQMADNIAIKVGQWKDNVFHEENVQDVRQLAVDRSLVNELIGGGITDYVQGVAVLYNDKSMPLRGEISFHDGIDNSNTAFTNIGGGVVDPDFTTGKTNFGVSGRAEYALMGNFNDYMTLTRAATWEGHMDKQESKDMLVVGAGFDVTQAGNTNAFFHTVDAEWKPANLDKLAVYGAYLGVYTGDADVAGGTQNHYDWGFLVQAGWMLNNKWEVFGRYDYTGLDSNRSLPEDSISELTLGVNYYWHGQGAKFTVDGSWLPNGSPAGVPSLGYLPSTDDALIVRAQVQLAI